MILRIANYEWSLALELSDEGMCFACGPNNPIGLHLKFEFEDGGYVARFTPRREHMGYSGIVHGGILSTLMDEAMARMVYAMGHWAVTADMQVRFKKPAPVGRELIVTGRLVSERGRIIDCTAEARDAEGELYVEATGRMMKVKRDA